MATKKQRKATQDNYP
jgi:hypothetical protein